MGDERLIKEPTILLTMARKKEKRRRKRGARAVVYTPKDRSRSKEGFFHPLYFYTLGVQFVYTISSLPDSFQEQLAQSPITTITGASLTALGVGLGVRTQVYMKQHFSHNPDGSLENTLATDGPYGLVRHPIYSCFRAANVGMGLMFPTPINIGLTVAALTFSEAQSRAEERRCLKDFGPNYAEYKERTPRWIPRIKTLKQRIGEYSVRHPKLTGVVNTLGTMLG